MFDHTFDCSVGQPVVADFEQFVQPLESLPRKSHKRNRDAYILNSTTVANSKIKHNLTKTFWLDCIITLIN